MAKFISVNAPRGWHPKAGDYVLGRAGKKEFKGIVRANRRGDADIFNIHGCVLINIMTDQGFIKAINEVQPLGQ